MPDLTLTIKHALPSCRNWDLARLLFPKLAGKPKNKAAALMESGKAGEPEMGRLPLLIAIRDEFAADIARGTSANTIAYQLYGLNAFYSWGEAYGHHFTTSTIDEDFYAYAEHLYQRFRHKRGLTEESARAIAGSLSSILTRSLERKTALISYTHLKSGRHKKRVIGTKADKQNLTDTYAFGHLLLTIVNALTPEAISGPLPVRAQLNSGHTMEFWSGHKPKKASKSSPSAQAIERISDQLDISTLQRTRSSLINIAIEAHLLIFIAQTGMNLSQAANLRAGSYRYQSHLDGYKVFSTYKARRQGTVEFEIHGAYRSVFEAYLTWRNLLLPDAGEDAALFTFVTSPRDGGGVKSRSFHMMGFQKMKALCKRHNTPYFAPQKLRKTKVNWLLRYTDDPALTADMAQHSQEVLLHQYAQPHHQRAAAEISRFHADMDPKIAMPGAGVCVNATPLPLNNVPKNAPEPDCQSPAGCLFCSHQRDIEDFDHAWSLVSYRYLKTQELTRQTPTASRPNTAPVSVTVDRLTDKITEFKRRSDTCDMWIREAVLRIEEGDYHPKWDAFIQLIEAQAT